MSSDNKDKLVGKHHFTFNKGAGGGSLILYTEMYDNGDHQEPYYNQKLTLHSNGNSTSFELVEAPLTPELLRQLADELEEATSEATFKMLKIEIKEQKAAKSKRLLRSAVNSIGRARG